MQNNVQQAYNEWSQQYDTNDNRTRDLEAISLREMIASINFKKGLEIGCGTGKNTMALLEKAAHITAVDLSEGMLAQAKEKIQSPNVHFRQADITGAWDFTEGVYDLVTFSLVLEHIEQLDGIFEKTAAALQPGGYVYAGELHPFKQYNGTKARFDTSAGTQVVTCFNHHISDFTGAAQKNGLALLQVKEYFDDNDRTQIPRILSLLFRKP